MTTLVHPGAAKMATEIPASVVTPDVVETRLGTLRLKDGFPDDATVEKVYDNLDFQRGVEAFLNGVSPVTLAVVGKAIRDLGPVNQTVMLFENLMDSRTLLPAPNTETVYAGAWIDLHDGPVVFVNPPGTVGFASDAWSHFLTDLGNAGPDAGNGGKYLIVPPGYKGDIPNGYYVCKSATFGAMFLTRGFLVDGKTEPAAQNIKRHLRIYPLAQAANPPETRFVNCSGKPIVAVCPLDFSYYETLDEIVQREPNEAMDPETLGVLASIGIEKGKPFAPDARMKKLLVDAAAVGSVTARAITYKTRLNDAYLYPNSAWMMGFVGGSYEFERDGVRLLDARTYWYFYGGFGTTPGLSAKMIGRGSQYAFAFVDSKARPLEGAKTYKLHLPAQIPAKNFWSIIAYDNQTRTLLQTDQQFPSVSSQKTDLAVNPDTSVDVYFGPEAPNGEERNWIQTRRDKGFGVVLRLYGPLEAWFDRTWKPGELEQA